MDEIKESRTARLHRHLQEGGRDGAAGRLRTAARDGRHLGARGDGCQPKNTSSCCY